MGKLQLFHATLDGARELKATPFRDEDELRILFDRYLSDLTGIDFLDSEHFTGRRHRRFTDTLGLDSKQRPVVIEYKHGQGGAAITQGLDYLDWLSDHKGDFRELVRENLDSDRSRNIDFKNAWLLCVAGGFKREDEINAKTNTHRIELLCVLRLGESTILMEWVLGGEDVPKSVPSTKPTNKPKQSSEEPDFKKYQYWEQLKANAELYRLFETLREHVCSLGSEVWVNPTKYYLSFRSKRTVAYVKAQTGKKRLLVYVHSDLESFVPRKGFTRLKPEGIRYPPCNVEIEIGNRDNLEEAKDLLEFSYRASS